MLVVSWVAPFGFLIQLIQSQTSQTNKKQCVWSLLLEIFFPLECIKYLYCVYLGFIPCEDGASFFFQAKGTWLLSEQHTSLKNCSSYSSCIYHLMDEDVCFFLKTTKTKQKKKKRLVRSIINNISDTRHGQLIDTTVTTHWQKRQVTQNIHVTQMTKHILSSFS